MIEPEPNVDAIFGGLVKVDVVVRDLVERDRRLAIHERDLSRLLRRAQALGVDEFRGHQHDEEERADIHRTHPKPLAAGAPESLAALGWGRRRGRGLARFDLEKDHQRSQREDRNEKENVVADDRPDHRHLLLGGGKDAIFRELMQAADDQLRGYKPQDHRGDTEEFLQVDAHAALDEHHAKADRSDHSQQGTQETQEFGGVQGDRRKNQHRFHAFPHDHQEDEKKHSDAGTLAGQGLKFAFNFTLHLLAGTHHEDDHGDDEEGGSQHHPAFDDVFIQVQAGDQDGHANAAHEGCSQGDKNGLAKVGTADLGQVGKSDAYDQGRLDSLAKRNDKGLQHGRSAP